MTNLSFSPPSTFLTYSILTFNVPSLDTRTLVTYGTKRFSTEDLLLDRTIASDNIPCRFDGQWRT